MKTKKSKKITKKYIKEVLRTEDVTKIFHLFFQIHGYIDRNEMLDFIRENAPLKRIQREAYDIVYLTANRYRRYSLDATLIRRHGIYDGDKKHHIIAYLKEQCADPTSPYAKRPMYGYTHLYFCSPIYGHSDYNKWRTIEIKGNEKFCEKLIAYADKYFKN
jgi:hypothetical protein